MKTRPLGKSLENGGESVVANVHVYKLFCCREREIAATVLSLQYGMEESKNKYVLLVDRVGHKLIKGYPLPFGPSTNATPTQVPVEVLRGELLKALPEAQQPSDFHRMVLAGIERKSLRLECLTADLTRLSDEEANLLLAISSLGGRYKTFIDQKRLDFGQRLSPGNQVFVSVKGSEQDLPGVVQYKGELPPRLGTVFGVELTVGINSLIEGFMYFFSNSSLMNQCYQYFQSLPQ